jgi:circadian clock protein KaiC
MARVKKQRQLPAKGLEKSPSGIQGFDEVLGGGLPKGRPTLLCGSAGCGKTLFAIEFLVRGATQFHEPGVFMAFEENEDDLAKNVLSLGFDLKRLAAQKKIALDYVRIERSEISETGDYDLEGLFIRLGHAIDSLGAKRVVIDTIEALFAGLSNEAVLRAELRRLFAWLKNKGVTAIITGERGEGTLTRYGLEEYVADCVILLDHRVSSQMSTRRLRVVKYRGSLHGTNEYPFLIGQHGISVLPITGLGLNHAAPRQHISSGVPRLDTMLGGKGYFRGSTILASGTAGTGKTTLAAALTEAACKRGERVLYYAFEESRDQIIRNMDSVGFKLAPWVKKGLLQFQATRPVVYGLEMHLVSFHECVRAFKPRLVIIDPLTDLLGAGNPEEVKSMLTRLIDFYKNEQITAFFTSLTAGGNAPEQSEVGISSLMDTWLLLRNLENSGERNRALYVLKSRGMAHSNQVREFKLSSKGIELIDVYTGSGLVLTGAARLAQQASEKAELSARDQLIARLRRDVRRKEQSARAQIAILQTTLESELEELHQKIAQETGISARDARNRQAMARKRKADNGSLP